MRPALAVSLAVGFTMVASFCHAAPIARPYGVCVAESVGVDTSLANNSGDVILGEAIGQTFLASDTLLSSLTVWRVADECQNFLIGMHLYVTRADSADKPLTSEIVLDGPTITIPSGDCVHPIPFTWTFDPPLVLPGVGTYAFFVTVAASQCPNDFNVLGHTGDDAYSPGSAWGTNRTFFCDLPGGVRLLTGDLVFTVVLCSTHTVSTLRSTWGELKTHYR